MKTQVQHFPFRALFLTFALIFTAISCELDDPFDQGDTIDELTGNWTCAESSSQLGNTTYTVTISSDPMNINGILIENFYGINSTVEAVVSGSILTIPDQTTPDNYTIFGSGTISGNRNTINLQYTVDDNSGGPVDNCTAVYEAQ